MRSENENASVVSPESVPIHLNTVGPQWLEHVWYHKNIFATGVVRDNEVNRSAKSVSL